MILQPRTRQLYALFTLSLIGSTLGLPYPSPAVTSAEQYRQRGLAYRQQEQFPAAIAALQAAVELEPDHLGGRVILGWTLHLAGQDTEAAAVLQENLRRNGFDVPTLNALGIVYLVQGELPAALLTHGWAAFLKPDNEVAYYNMGLTLHRLKQYDWAIAVSQQAAELEPNNPHPLVAIAIAHWAVGDRAAAAQTYRQAIALDPRYSEPGFLIYLEQAGFSIDQIQASQQVRVYMLENS